MLQSSISALCRSEFTLWLRMSENPWDSGVMDIVVVSVAIHRLNLLVSLMKYMDRFFPAHFAIRRFLRPFA